MSQLSKHNNFLVSMAAVLATLTHQSWAAPQLFNSGSSNSAPTGGFGSTGSQFGGPSQQQFSQASTQPASNDNTGFSVGLFTGGSTQSFPTSTGFNQGSQQSQSNGFGNGQKQFAGMGGGGFGSGSMSSFQQQQPVGQSQFGGVSGAGGNPSGNFQQSSGQGQFGGNGGFANNVNNPSGSFQQPPPGQNQFGNNFGGSMGSNAMGGFQQSSQPPAGQSQFGSFTPSQQFSSPPQPPTQTNNGQTGFDFGSVGSTPTTNTFQSSSPQGGNQFGQSPQQRRTDFTSATSFDGRNDNRPTFGSGGRSSGDLALHNL